jgi:hypothetical protein
MGRRAKGEGPSGRMFGVARRLDHGLLPFMGPAQIGAGHPEEPYRPPTDPKCPICGRSLSAHDVIRSDSQFGATRLICPA